MKELERLAAKKAKETLPELMMPKACYPWKPGITNPSFLAGVVSLGDLP